MSFTNASNETVGAEPKKESLVADIIVPMVVWTGMGIGEVLFATLLLMAIIINKSLHRTQYFFIANLMICDLISSFTVNFMVTGITINSLIDRTSQGANCILVDTLYFPFTTSFIMVTVLIFDRFLLVVSPFRYRTIMTNKVAVALVAGCWIIGILLSSYTLFDPEHKGLYTRNGFCPTNTILSRILSIVIPNVLATSLAIIQIFYLSLKAHKLSKQVQRRQSLSGERLTRIALSRKAIWTLVLLVGIAGILGVIIPLILSSIRLLVGNATETARIIQNGVVPFFGKMPTIAHSLLYGFHLPEIRKAILKMLKPLTCRNHQ